MYDARCPASNDCSSIDRAEPDTPDHCCENLEDGQKCQPDCVQWIANDETAMPCETGFYRHFESNKTSGKPYGCAGFDDPSTGWIDGGKSTWPECGLEEYAPEGEMLYEIVDEFADDQQIWMDNFVPTFEKMLSNGYGADSMDLADGPTGWFGEWFDEK